MTERRYNVAAVEKAIRVMEFLGRGDILGWKPAAEVAAGAGISQNEAFRLLQTLAEAKWVEKGERGYRLAATGLMEILIYVQGYVSRLAREFGVAQMDKRRNSRALGDLHLSGVVHD